MKPKVNRAAKPYVAQKIDACQTPAYALDPLLPYLRRFVDPCIWEPANGAGQLSNALRTAGFEYVYTSDILTGESFFDFKPLLWDMIVTNPPYSLKFAWLKRCYELGKPFALLVPVEMIGAASGQVLMQRYGFEIMLLDKRVNFNMPNKGYEGHGAQFPVLWLTWRILPSPVVFGAITYPPKPKRYRAYPGQLPLIAES